MIGGGSAGYFSDPQRWLALILVISYPSTFIIHPKNPPVAKFSFSGIKLTTVLFVIVLIPLILSSLENILTLNKSFVLDNIETRTSLLPDKNPLKTEGHYVYIRSLMKNQKMTLLQSVVLALNEPQKRLEEGSNKDYQLVKYIQNLDKMPPGVKKSTAMFIPQDNQIYWNMLSYKKIQFAAPALSGIAMIDQIQPFVAKKLDQATIDTNVKKLSEEEKKSVMDTFVKTRLPSKNSNDLGVSEYSLRQNLSIDKKNQIYDLFSANSFAQLVDYGFESYQIGLNEQNYLIETGSDINLCKEAVLKGFDNIIVVTTDKDDLPQSRNITCRQ
jgi:hypothetical protein